MEKEIYENYCMNSNIAVDDVILKSFMKSSASGELSLAGVSLNVTNCEVIGNVLCMCQSVTKLDLSDCLLPQIGLGTLLDKLTLSHVQHLNLKGNNILGPGTSRLARLLKSRSLKVLSLQWNNIGSSLDSFSQFCHALSNNQILEVLDLRNNELTVNCGIELADVFLRNSTLKTLDLRWNNIGAEGGQRILEVMRSNKTLSTIQVQGNSIPAEIMSAIEETVEHNTTVQKMQSEYTARNKLLTKHIKLIEQQRSDELKTFSQQSSQQLQSALEKIREQVNEKSELLKQLEEAQIQCEKFRDDIVTLSSQLDVSQRKLFSTEAFVIECEAQIKNLREKACEKCLDLSNVHHHQSTLGSTTQSIQRGLMMMDLSIERSWKNKLNEKDKALTEEIEDLKRNLHDEQLKNRKLEIAFSERQSEVELMTTDLSTLNSKLQNVIATNNKARDEERQQHSDAIEKLQQEILSQQTKSVEALEKCQQAANQKLQYLEAKLQELEFSKSEQSAQFLSERAKWSEEKSAILAEASEKQMCKLMLVNEKLERSKEDKERLEQELSALRVTNSTLQHENSSLKADIAEHPRKIGQLQEELNSERLLVQRLRSEKYEEVRTAEGLKQECARHKNDLTSAQQQIIDLTNQLEKVTSQHRKEIENINIKLEEKSREVSAIRAEEMERAGVLYMALNRYLGGINPAAKS